MRAMYVVIFLLSVFISAISQTLLKLSAERRYPSKIKEYVNGRVVAAYTLFFASSLLTVLAYRGVPLSTGSVLETTGYIWVTILGKFVLGEKVNARKMLGLVVIVFGVLLSGVL